MIWGSFIWGFAAAWLSLAVIGMLILAWCAKNAPIIEGGIDD